MYNFVECVYCAPRTRAYTLHYKFQVRLNIAQYQKTLSQREFSQSVQSQVHGRNEEFSGRWTHNAYTVCMVEFFCSRHLATHLFYIQYRQLIRSATIRFALCNRNINYIKARDLKVTHS